MDPTKSCGRCLELAVSTKAKKKAFRCNPPKEGEVETRCQQCADAGRGVEECLPSGSTLAAAMRPLMQRRAKLLKQEPPLGAELDRLKADGRKILDQVSAQARKEQLDALRKEVRKLEHTVGDLRAWELGRERVDYSAFLGRTG